MIYYEIRILDRWSTRTSETEPVVRDGRLVSANGQGPRVRGVKRVPAELEHLSLAELQARLWPDGRTV